MSQQRGNQPTIKSAKYSTTEKRANITQYVSHLVSSSFLWLSMAWMERYAGQRKPTELQTSWAANPKTNQRPKTAIPPTKNTKNYELPQFFSPRYQDHVHFTGLLEFSSKQKIPSKSPRNFIIFRCKLRHLRVHVYLKQLNVKQQSSCELNSNELNIRVDLMIHTLQYHLK